MIPYGKQDINQADIAAVVAVLQSDFLTQGPQVPLFEQALAKTVQAQYGVAVNSATSALHIACLALGLGKGDCLWTSPNTFVASANCARYCQAKVDFVDIDPRTYNMCPDALHVKLIDAQRHNTLPKIVMPVHFAGQPCDMQRIHALAQEYGFKIIEDASHAIGATYHNLPVGACQYSDITVFSFHPVKIITSAEGGMAMCNDVQLAEQMRLLRSHGVTHVPAQLDSPHTGEWYYEQVTLGLNYRMIELQAALGLSQLQRLPVFLAQRQHLRQRYDCLLKDLPLQLPVADSMTTSANHLYPIQLNALEQDSSLSRQPSRKAIFDRLRAQGIGVHVHYIPVHTQPYYQTLGFAYGDYPQSEHYYQHALSLPLYHGMTEQQQDQVIEELADVLMVCA